MTAPTLPRPSATPPAAERRAAAAPTPGPAAPGGGRSPAALLAFAELTLTAITVTAVAGLSRLFVDGSFLAPVLLFALGGHALAVACRRAGIGSITTTLVGAAGLVVGVTWFLLPETSVVGLPTPGTVDAALAQLGEAFATFREVVAPAPVEPGFVLAAAVGVWIVAFTADTAAFRASAPVEAVVPAATLFVFGAALGAPKARLPVTAAFLAAVLAYWLAQRALRQRERPTWLATEAGDGASSLLRTGAVLAVVSVALAVVVGPELPGADDSGIVPWRAADREGPGTRVTVSPLVDIRSRIVDQADVEVFSVTSDRRSYWRLTSLETFDGSAWSSRADYRMPRGELEPALPAQAARRSLATQVFEIAQLESIWLPAAFEPVRVEGIEHSYDDDSGSLLYTDDERTEPGVRYTVTSSVKDLTASDLAAVADATPTDVPAVYRELPDGFSVRVQQLAQQIAGDPALTPYEQALRLQDHFRDGSFTYDLQVQPGHDDAALEAFLFETRTGYCEQYAGAYAALARAVGLPARVAVGFTPGERDADGRYVVRGLNGHAWPEVYLAGYGWVPFEPTPGRGIPGGEDYTRVPEQQATPGDQQAAPTSTTSTTTPGSAAPAAGPTTLPTIFPEEPGAAAPAADAGTGAAGVLLFVLGALVGLPLLWAALLAAVARLRRHRRRSGARTAGDRVRAAWADAADALALVGLRQEPWETPAEFARRAGDDVATVDRRALRRLADAVTAADYAEEGTTSEAPADAATADAAAVERAVRDTADGRTKLRWAVDPRPLLPRRAARWDVREAETSTGPVRA